MEMYHHVSPIVGIEGDWNICEDTHLSRDRDQNWSTGILDIELDINRVGGK